MTSEYKVVSWFGSDVAGIAHNSRNILCVCAGKLKEECTVLVVSHDLRELEPLIDMAWEMEAGGRLKSVQWPPVQET